jgi:hypothetical protein
MTITFHSDEAKDLTVFKVSGELNFEAVMPFVKAFYDGTPTRHVVWDMTDVSEADFSSEQVEQIAGLPSRFQGKRAEGKTALVVKKDILFGLSRMFEIHSNVRQAPFPIGVFRNLEDAYKWIEES